MQETRELLRNTCCCFLSGRRGIWREREGKAVVNASRRREFSSFSWAEGQILSSGPNKKPPTQAQRQICNCFQQGWRREGGRRRRARLEGKQNSKYDVRQLLPDSRRSRGSSSPWEELQTQQRSVIHLREKQRVGEHSNLNRWQTTKKKRSTPPSPG